MTATSAAAMPTIQGDTAADSHAHQQVTPLEESVPK
ncbi:Uncharacterised protein [Pseudescherichia vulneris]|nr:Uncharacterised protein [Pseudescherichia vulneris]